MKRLNHKVRTIFKIVYSILVLLFVIFVVMEVMIFLSLFGPVMPSRRLLFFLIMMIAAYLIFKKGAVAKLILAAKDLRLFTALAIYFLGVFIFLFGLFSMVEFVYLFLLISYFSLATILIRRKQLKKFWWLLALILFLQVIFMSEVIPSKPCVGKVRGTVFSSCDCMGLEQGISRATRCIGKRTACYSLRGGGPDLTEIDCDEFDKGRR